MTTLGSGEGIAKQYAYRDAKTKEIVTVTDTLLFNDTEIESVEALAKRGGSIADEPVAEDLHRGATWLRLRRP